MKQWLRIAAGVAAILVGVAACGGDDNGSTGGGGEFDKIGGDANATGTLKIWLQEDAQTGWQKLVDDANAAFKAKFPKVNVDVQYQKWTDHLTKLDAALSGTDVPDVVEMGNTETTQYVVNGAFADLTSVKNNFDNSSSWNKALEESCTSDGKLFCVPYYGGSRAVAYNKDMFAAAGITAAPKTYEELLAAGDKLMAKFGTQKGFSAFYTPGRFWYLAMTYVNDAGGNIAKKGSDGKWQSGLDTPEATAGLTKWNELVQKYFRGDKTTDEAQPQQYTVMAQGKSAMMYGLGWEGASVPAPKDKGGNPALKDKIGTFALPSPTKSGEAMQSFGGGSDLAITAKSKNKAWAAAWIKEFTGNTSQEGLLAAKNIPNTTTLLDKAQQDPSVAPFAASAKSSWFVPVAKNWSKVEKGNVMQLALVDLVTGKSTPEAAGKKMAEEIEKILNEA